MKGDPSKKLGKHGSPTKGGKKFGKHGDYDTGHAGSGHKEYGASKGFGDGHGHGHGSSKKSGLRPRIDHEHTIDGVEIRKKDIRAV